MHEQPLAYMDPAFLESDEARPIRIITEYLEPLQRLKEQNIQDTVVFFGSARVHSRVQAERALERLQKRNNRRKPEFAAALKRSRKALEWSRYYEDARIVAHELTKWSLSLESPRHRFAVCSGGGPSIMEAANRGAWEEGQETIGLNIVLPHEQLPNRYVTPELSFQFHYFALRKMHFLLRARAVAVFPGGYGTFDELFELLTLVQTGKVRPLPILLFGRDYWDRVVNFDAMVEEGVISPHDLDLLRWCEKADEAWDFVKQFYERDLRDGDEIQAKDGG